MSDANNGLGGARARARVGRGGGGSGRTSPEHDVWRGGGVRRPARSRRHRHQQRLVIALNTSSGLPYPHCAYLDRLLQPHLAPHSAFIDCDL